MKLTTICSGLLALTAMLIPAAGTAQAQGRHPAYLHARSDLRAAQFLMRVREEPNVTRNLRVAADEAEAAIHEIDNAAILDHKDIEDHPHVDEGMPRAGRFRRTMELLREARADLGREEDNGRARGWRDAAYRHIDGAIDHVRRAAVDAHLDHELGF